MGKDQRAGAFVYFGHISCLKSYYEGKSVSNQSTLLPFEINLFIFYVITLQHNTFSQMYSSIITLELKNFGLCVIPPLNCCHDIFNRLKEL